MIYYILYSQLWTLYIIYTILRMINYTVCDLCNSRVPSEVHICPNAWDWRASIQKSRRLKLRRIRDDAETLDWKQFMDLYGRLRLWSHEMGECYALQCRIIEICGKVIHWRDRRLPPCRCTLASNLAQLQSYAILSQSEFQPWFTYIWFIWFICLKCLKVLVQVRPQAGFYYQLTNGFALEFPYSLIMLPCTIVEWIIRWHIYTWAYSRSESRQPESLAMLSFSPRRSRPRPFFWQWIWKILKDLKVTRAKAQFTLPAHHLISLERTYVNCTTEKARHFCDVKLCREHLWCYNTWGVQTS